MKTTVSILVVEDDLFLQRMFQIALPRLGYQLLLAGSGDEALDLLRHKEVDLVITDVDMPGSVDGIELARRVLSEWGRTGVLVTSGKHCPIPVQLPFLPKPFSLSQLEETIRVLLKKPSGPEGEPGISSRVGATSKGIAVNNLTFRGR